MHREHVRRDRALEPNAALAGGMTQEWQELRHHIGGGDGFQLRGLRTDDVEEAGDDARDPVDLRDDRFQVFAPGIVRGQVRSVNSARPEMILSGVPTSCASPAASLPATASIAACRAFCSRSRARSVSARESAAYCFAATLTSWDAQASATSRFASPPPTLAQPSRITASR